MSIRQGANSFGSYACAHWEKRITLNEFFRRAIPILRQVGAKLMRRWRAPPSVDLEDVVQELMVGCIWAFKRFDPSRGTSVDRYVMFNACDKAKKWLHKQRGAKLHGKVDAAPGRYALLFQDVADRRGHRRDRASNDEGTFEFLSDKLKSDPEQFECVERRELWRRHIYEAPTDRLRFGMIALEHCRGERGEAARFLLADMRSRIELRLNTERAARKVIWEAVRYLAAA